MHTNNLPPPYLPTAPRSKFDGFLPQGGEEAKKERRESYDKALAESKLRDSVMREVDAVRRSAHKDEWLVRFKRVWQDDG